MTSMIRATLDQKDSFPRIAFSWHGLPQYAARLILAAIERLGEPCAVIGSRPNVPVEGMERVLAQKVYWVDAERPIVWSDLGLAAPQLFMQSGWSYPAFASLGREVKARGGRVIGLSDANWLDFPEANDLRVQIGCDVASGQCEHEFQ